MSLGGLVYRPITDFEKLSIGELERELFEAQFVIAIPMFKGEFVATAKATRDKIVAELEKRKANA